MNPFLPLTEYVPDGEPHVFGDRVYLYGSHDEPSGKRFCTRDYTVWSAPVRDLSRWTCHGVTYRKAQDPRSKPGKEVDFYAPDCTQGPDGRYYLYYFVAGPNTKPFGPMSVAVADRPEGPFDYYGDIRYSDGTPVLRYLTNRRSDLPLLRLGARAGFSQPRIAAAVPLRAVQTVQPFHGGDQGDETQHPLLRLCRAGAGHENGPQRTEGGAGQPHDGEEAQRAL